MSVSHEQWLSSPATAPAFVPIPDRTRPIDPIELYASAIDTSDYARRVASVVLQHVPQIGDLLDVGAGGGQLGRALRAPGRTWTAVEPSPAMRARLERLDGGPRIVAAGWENAEIAPDAHDTVLAANVGAHLLQTNAFLRRCCAWARRKVVWVVHAQQGPHGLVYAGCLPAAWHGEDETPGVDIVLQNLAAGARPHASATVEWTFSGVVADLDALATYLADRLGWAPSDRRRRQMADHLAGQAKREPGGYRLDIPRKSAILIWGAPWAGICVPSV